MLRLFLQLRASVCLTASDELMNGLFNKPLQKKGKNKNVKEPNKDPGRKPQRANGLGCIGPKSARIKVYGEDAGLYDLPHPPCRHSPTPKVQPGWRWHRQAVFKEHLQKSQDLIPS